MRVTQQVRSETRQRILDAAQVQFRSKGFQQTTTRQIAKEAGIATGTLFNYFRTKEAIVMTLMSEALHEARDEFQAKHRVDASIEEDLFSHIAIGLRKLKPHRCYVGPAIESALSPLVGQSADEIGEAARLGHLELVASLLNAHGVTEFPPMAAQLYWTLYIGLLGFWIEDPSPKQEETLALLDQSIRMYVQWLNQHVSAN